MDFSDLISPKTEEILSAIPNLLGAFESARGKPIGTVLQMLGGYGTQNAQNRTNKSDVAALQKLVGGFNQQNAPAAYNQYQQLQPLLAQMSPEMQAQQLGNIQSLGEKEETKTPRLPQKYFNSSTNGVEYHDETEFQNGVIPKNLVPWQTPAATQLYNKAMGVTPPQKADDFRTGLDAASNAKFGSDYATLAKKNPQAAYQVYTEVKKIGAEAAFSNANALLQPRADVDLSKQIEAANQIARNNSEREVQDKFNISPDKFRALPPDQKQKMIDAVDADSAARAAKMRSATSKAAADTAVEYRSKQWLATPVMASHYFSVDPKTGEIGGDFAETIGDARNAGKSLVAKAFQASYVQGMSALKGLDRMNTVGDKILGKYGTVPTTEAELYYKRFRGDPDATAFKAAQVNLISALRNITGTSRPNQLEIKTAIDTVKSVATKQSLAAAINQVKKAVQDNLGEMQQRSVDRYNSEKERRDGSAALSAMGGGSAVEAPDPGWSTTIAP